jgi:LacI family transcriptional regulator
MQKKKKVSLNDIARKLNISKSTVSFIVNGKAKEMRISEELTQTVMKLVDELGFRPNHLAQSLATGKTNSIGLIVENISDPFFANIASLIEERAYNSGYKIIYSSTNGDPEKAISLMNLFAERKVDGFIISPPAGVEKEVQILIDDGTPVILFDRYLPDISTDYVGIDNEEITRKACTYLYKQGYKNIAFVTLESEQSQMKERQKGYEAVLEKYKLDPFILKIPYNYDDRESIRKISGLLKKTPQIDAICFATNYLGVNGLEAIRNLKLAIPENLGIVVFDDNELFRLYTPSITAIAQPMEEISVHLIDILLQKLSAGKTKPALQNCIIPAKLIIRNSTDFKASKKP